MFVQEALRCTVLPEVQELLRITGQFLPELSADPLGWLSEQLSDLPAVLERAGVPPEVADPSDAASLRDIAPAIVGVTSMMLDKVRAGELGLPPADDAVDSIRNGWL